MSFYFRWLGAAGLELKAGDQVLAIDPFFTRPSLFQMLQPIQPDPTLAVEKLPVCDAVLVTHPHYDHLLDVPIVLQHTGAVAYGSANTCKLLRILGCPNYLVREAQVGDQLTLGEFQVEVIRGQHSLIPFERFFNGSIPANLHPPLHVWDYRMDTCLGYSITVMGTKILVCAAQPLMADILFCVAQESTNYYRKMFQGVNLRVFIPIHWDNFTRPLRKPLRRLTRPGRISLGQLTRLCHQVLPKAQVLIPEIFSEYTF